MALTPTITQQESSYAVSLSATSNSITGATITLTLYEGAVELYTTTINYGDSLSYDFGKAGDFTVNFLIKDSSTGTDEDDVDFTVDEYKPVFTFPTITCKEYGQEAILTPTSLSINENACPIDPLTQEIEYKRYSFNMSTSAWVLEDTDIITIDPEDVILDNLAYTWTPTSLTKVKFVIKVTNCSTSVTKELEFPICGVWKVRRIACGNYRLYNYLSSQLSYTLTNSLEESVDSGIIDAFSYVEFPSLPDDIYKVNAGGTVAYIINYCAIEACVLSLQKDILLEDSCDECKASSILYKKATRIIPIYETWKKLLDKDGVYYIQYSSTDIDGELARIYDASELYLELKKLCDECNSKKSRKCC